MSIDIATLGIKFDSSGLVKAQKELDKTSQAGSKFEKTGGLISKSMADAGNSSSKSGGLISKSMSSAATSLKSQAV